MCGICGIVAGRPGGGSPSGDTLHRMAMTLEHRGPDDEGIVVQGAAGLAARRLSIIDVEGGHQPISNEDETIWCVQNGEIYNHPELIAHLQERGHQFRTRCDTEVIVHLYEEYGPAGIERLDGMFALAIWDTRRQRLLLARDRLGIKPLYYSVDGGPNGELLFGSELKALLAAGLPRALDPAALDAYFTLSYIPAPFTIFSAARKLPPGHTLVFEDGEAHIAPYWTLPHPQRTDASREELAGELRGLLRAAVRRHMISDVPLGAFLSGGLDSSTVVALMAEASPTPIKTFSVGFDERSYDETPFARTVAEVFGADHHELVQRPDPNALIDTLSLMYDEPFADSSALATYSVAALARRHVTVALTGDGGDEVFGGYLTYRAHQMAGLYSSLPSPLRDHLIPRGVALLPPSDRKVSFEYRAKRFVHAATLPPVDRHLGWKVIFNSADRQRLLHEAPDGALALMRHIYEGASGDPISAALRVDTLLGLPDDMLTKVDRATMAVSLEARVPLLDRAVVEFMAALPSSYKVRRWELKSLLRAAVGDLLPRSILTRKKEGFNIPVARWLRTDLRDLMLDVLSPAHLGQMDAVDEAMVAELIRDHLSERVDNGRKLWSLLIFGLWHAHYLEGAGVAFAAQ